MQTIHAVLFEPIGCLADSIEDAAPFEDVIPALSELKAMRIRLAIASSLPADAVTSFIERAGLKDFFDAVCTGDTAVQEVLSTISVEPDHAMFLTATEEGLNLANSLGVNSILMMNDPDEAMRLSEHNPSGGIVSLHELPDFIRLVAYNASKRRNNS
jgi:phosphoglycolate phosphatase-like HAD superfamily hydrolase